MSRIGTNIYKRKDGRWEGRFVKGRNKEGKTLYGYVYAKTYQAVKQRLEEIEDDPKKYFVGERTSTFLQMSDQWLSMIEIKVKSSTYARY